MTQGEKSKELKKSINDALSWLTFAVQQIDEPDDDCQTAIRSAVKALMHGIERCNEVGECEEVRGAREERNALAKLAEQLNRVGVELCCDQLDNESKDAVRKAQCIIAELADVEWDVAEMWPMHDYEAVEALVNCRKIAEEGVKDAH